MTDGRVQRRLAAVLAADVAGYSRLMGADEVGTLEALKSHRREVVDPAIADHSGRIVKTTGDGLLVEFSSAVDAITCAMLVQSKMAERNETHVPVIEFRIGINVGDIIIDGGDIFGDGVNVAARVENECDPGGVCLSSSAFEQVRGKTDFAFDDLGEKSLKNIDRPVRLYAAPAAETLNASKAAPSAEAKQPLQLPDKPSIAVLPFQNMSGDPEQEYFADGLVEDITTALSRFKSLFVIARNSSFAYKGRAIDIKQVGRELGVRYLLEGSVRKSGSRLRITGQLIDTSTGTHLWAEKIDGSVEDVFDLQDQITTNVVGLIAPKIEQAEIDRATQKPTDKLDSYEVYLQAVALLNKRMFVEARRVFEKALEFDPQCAAAYAGAAAAIAWQQGVDGTMLGAEHRVAALELANTGAGLANEDALVLARCGHVLVYLGREYDRGRAMVEQAVSLNQNLATAWQSLGWVSIICGEPERAIESFDNMMRLSPLDPAKASAACGALWALWLQRRYEEGYTKGTKLLQVFKHVQSIGAYIANAVGAGEIAQASLIVPELLKLDPGFSIKHSLDVFPMQSSQLREQLASALRSVGLPE